MPARNAFTDPIAAPHIRDHLWNGRTRWMANRIVPAFGRAHAAAIRRKDAAFWENVSDSRIAEGAVRRLFTSPLFHGGAERAAAFLHGMRRNFHDSARDAAGYQSHGPRRGRGNRPAAA